MVSFNKFREVSKTTVSETIVIQFKEKLNNRELVPGQKLPPIRQLAEQFGVGNSSIREALTALAALGVVETNVGDGTYIRSDLSESVLAPLSWSYILIQGKLDDLLEARQLIEVQMAKLAAERATQDDINELNEITRRFEEAIGDQERCLKIDLEFHHGVAKAARNVVIRDVLLRLENLLESLIGQFLSDEDGQRLSLEGHRRILQTIENHDPVAAAKAMDDHLLDPVYSEQYLDNIR